MRWLSLTIKFPSETCWELSGALRGCPPLKGVADKQQSGEKRPCLQGRFVERLAWERGEGLPLLYDKISPAKSLLKKSNACYTIVVFS